MPTPFTLTYRTAAGPVRYQLAGWQVTVAAHRLMPQLARGVVWDVAVLDPDGGDVTADFPAFT